MIPGLLGARSAGVRPRPARRRGWFASDRGATLTSPIDEELAKAAGILLLLALAPQLIPQRFDGLILGVFVGLSSRSARTSATRSSAQPTRAATSVRRGDDRGADALIDSVALDVLRLFGAGLIWFIGRPDVRLARARRRPDPFLTSEAVLECRPAVGL
jgi:hypothetical protein